MLESHGGDNHEINKATFQCPITETLHLVGDQKFELSIISDTEVHMATNSYRRQLLDIVTSMSSTMRQMLTSPSFGFPKTLRLLHTDDSNESGCLLFTVETRELFCGRVVSTIPKYIVVKVVPYYLTVNESRLQNLPETGPGEKKYGIFTLSPNHLCVDEPSNVEAQMMLKYRKLVVKNVMPTLCILYRYLVIDNWRDVCATEIPFPFTMQNTWKKWDSDEKAGRIRKSAMVIVMEHCKDMSIHSYIREKGSFTTKEWRSIIFQAMFTLAVLDKLDSFRHNDCHFGNWGICTTPYTQMIKFIEFSFEGTSFWIPNTGLYIRLMDFDWAISKSVTNKKVFIPSVPPYVATPDLPPIFDVHRFLNSIYAHSTTPNAVRKFIHSVYSPFCMLYVTHKGSVVKNNPSKESPIIYKMPTPVSIMSHDFFADYRVMPTQTVFKPPFVFPADPALQEKLLVE